MAFADRLAAAILRTHYQNLAPERLAPPRADRAAAKVEALSSSGMEEIKILAFLRKQAD